MEQKEVDRKKYDTGRWAEGPVQIRQNRYRPSPGTPKREEKECYDPRS